jgi:MOSC domain-containing protein YiiM
MWDGSVLAIHIAPAGGEPMTAVDGVQAVAGRGLIGDRYYNSNGFYSYHPGPIREVSLIEDEVIEALRRDHHMDLAPGVTRRNILTRGVPLGHLVAREFRVGEAVLRGVQICEPCEHVVGVTGIKGLLPNLIHRGGLHAQIVTSGLIRVGDPVVPIA